MVKLPFVVQPRLQPIVEVIGTEESGQIEIERRGYLTVSEKATVQNALSDETAMTELYSLAGQVARKTGKSAADALQLILTNEAPEEFDDQVNLVLVGMMRFQEMQKMVQATALLMSRISAKWKVEDTLELHPDLLDALAKLYEEEEAKSIEALEKISDDAKKAEEEVSESAELKE